MNVIKIHSNEYFRNFDKMNKIFVCYLLNKTDNSNTFLSRESKLKMSSLQSHCFPIRNQPEVKDKFPFQDLKYYTMTEREIEDEKNRKIGFTARKSLKYLSSTGRDIDLNYVPWFRPASNKVRQF